MKLQLLAFLLGMGVLVVALCVRPVEAAAKSLSRSFRRARRRRRKAMEAAQAEATRRAFLARQADLGAQGDL